MLIIIITKVIKIFLLSVEMAIYMPDRRKKTSQCAMTLVTNQQATLMRESAYNLIDVVTDGLAHLALVKA